MKKPMLWLMLSLVLFSGCHFKNAVLLPSPAPHKAPIRDRYVILVNMDGSRPQEVEALAQAGLLPTIQKLFFEQGAVFENAITVFPTVSTPAHQSFISGLLPGHHGIPALDWYSRSNDRYIDYLTPKNMLWTPAFMFNFLQLLEGNVVSDAPQLLFAMLKGHPSLAVLEPANYGAGKHLPKIPPMAAAWKFKYGEAYEAIDLMVMKQFLKALKKTPQDQLPRFSFVDFYGMDNTGHFDGPTSERVKDLYIHYDRFFSELKKVLTDRGIWDRTTLIVVSDHGQHYLTGMVDQVSMLRKIGLEANPKSPTKGQVIWGDHGTGTNNLYFKVGSNWKRRPTYQELRNYPLQNGKSMDLVQAFLAQPEIEIVVLPETPLITHLYVKDQHARIVRKWQQGKFLFSYQPDPGQDPLEYLDNPTVQQWVEEKSFMDAEAWLQETAAERLPDVVVGLPQVFDDFRTGDMLIITYPETQFKEVKLAAHGSLLREDRRINLMFHGPDIKPGRYPHARTVDTYPTILSIFGLKSLAPMDGIVRTEILQEALNKTAKKVWGPHAQKKPGLTPQEFLNHLQTKLAQDSLTNAEKQKALQLIDTIELFFKHWSPAIN